MKSLTTTALIAAISIIATGSVLSTLTPQAFAQFDPEPNFSATQNNAPEQTNNYNSDAEITNNPEFDPDLHAEDTGTAGGSATQVNAPSQENNPTQINSNSPSMNTDQSFSQTPSVTCAPETGTFNSDEKLIGDEACRLF
jgi:hypothetical protein